MLSFECDPSQFDGQTQRVVRRILSGQATDAEIEQARQASGLSPLELLLLAEAIERQSVPFSGDVLHPLCGC